MHKRSKLYLSYSNVRGHLSSNAKTLALLIDIVVFYSDRFETSNYINFNSFDIVSFEMPTAGVGKSRKTGRSKAYAYPKESTWFRKHGVRWRSTIGVRSTERYIEGKEANKLSTTDPPDKHPAPPRDSADISKTSDKDDSESVASRVCSGTRRNGALCRGVGAAEKDIETPKRARRPPLSKYSKEHSASPKRPLGISHVSSEDDSEPVVCRRRKRRNGSMTQLDTIGKDLVSQVISSKSETDDEVLVREPPSKVRKLRTSALLPASSPIPGSLDEMEVEPSVPKVIDDSGKYEDHPILTEGDGEDRVRLANLTTQETSTAVCSLEERVRGKSFNGSHPMEAVESDDGQKFTYCWSSPERHAGEPPDPQMLQHASRSTMAISLVDDLRQAAAKRNNKAFASSTPVLRKTRRRFKSVSPMPKCMSELSERPPNRTLSPVEPADACVNDEVPISENPRWNTRRSKSVSVSSMSESISENSHQPARSPIEIADSVSAMKFLP